ncbi:MAG: cyclic nucleotide-binding domain-containing protein [Thermanaerothrix sp.]|jgi:CRP-like cAMP-binding protein|uniref:cyclic nucleotide-binding domain-containing protein n=1 Tax=Thermanaerothrix sp. TaxID=2972675 RepID=UPI003C7EB81E
MSRPELLTFPLFQGFSAEQVDHLLTLMEEHTYAAETEIFAQGTRAEFFYILFRGEVTIHYKPYDGPALVVAHILPGGVFGWSAALGRSTYTSSAVAVQESQVLRIRGEQLQHLCEYFPDTGAILMERLAGLIHQRLDNLRGDVLNMIGRGMDLKGECLRRIKNGRSSTPV